MGGYAVGLGEEHAFLSKSVNIRHLRRGARENGITALLVGHEDQNVRAVHGTPLICLKAILPRRHPPSLTAMADRQRHDVRLVETAASHALVPYVVNPKGPSDHGSFTGIPLNG